MRTAQELKSFVGSLIDGFLKEELLEALQELERYQKAEAEERLVEFPCKIGDYAEFSNGSILPVVYLTKSNNGDINVGCQNGNIISMKHHYQSWVKRFIPKEEYESQR